MAPLLIGTCALCQTNPPAFEVADIRIHDPGDTTNTNTARMLQETDRSYGLLLLRQTMTKGTVTLRGVPLRVLIELAWNAPNDALSGPDWMNGVSLDVVAKASSPQTSEDELCMMLQTLLKSRMKLSVRMEHKDLPVYVLSVYKGGPKLEKADPPRNTEDGHCRLAKIGDHPQGVACPHETMSALARDLSGIASKYVDRPVVDETGLQGAWNLQVGYTPVALIEREGGITLYAALQTQAGLTLKPGKRAMPVVVVDCVERVPEEN
jgi:uncharacterized protein (TIGR03435 family)